MWLDCSHPPSPQLSSILFTIVFCKYSRRKLHSKLSFNRILALNWRVAKLPFLLLFSLPSKYPICTSVLGSAYFCHVLFHWYLLSKRNRKDHNCLSGFTICSTFGKSNTDGDLRRGLGKCPDFKSFQGLALEIQHVP